MNLNLKKENAVSPVVGVMLMLVVTIVIAGIVAAFAGGLVSDTTPASTVSISLDDYEMGTVGYDDNYTAISFEWGYNVSQTGATSYNYAPYNMTLKHNGGDAFDISDLTLIVTFNGASYTTPFSDATNATTFSAGDIIELTASTTASTNSYGLSRQDMSYGPSTFTWAIKDNSGYIIAEGTAKTLVP
jgi:FlaG/FlaF family flagellin (archaellin)